MKHNLLVEVFLENNLDMPPFLLVAYKTIPVNILSQHLKIEDSFFPICESYPFPPHHEQSKY